ncbi:MAG: glycoside hydrolase family 9 protein [Waterburya sp.]
MKKKQLLFLSCGILSLPLVFVIANAEIASDTDDAESGIEAIDKNFHGQSNTLGTGRFAYGEVLQKSLLFYEANRSGRLPADQRIKWRSDSTLNDGADVGRDLTGGYYDAGDHIIFAQPFAFSLTMLSWGGVDYREAYQRSGQLDELLKTVKWGTDWFLKAHETDSSGKTARLWVQVGDASDHQHWVPAEEIDTKTERPSFAIDPDNPGSDAAAGAASALASASMLFRGIDDDYSAKLLQNAIALYNFAETYKGKYSDSVTAVNPFYTSWSGYWDELALGAAWLYRATGESAYLTKAENYLRDQIKYAGDWSYAADDHSYAAYALLAKESSDPYFKSEVNRWLGNWLNGVPPVQYSSGGFAFRTEWGSAALSLATAYIAEWYSDFIEPNQSYANFATKQLNYILGDNPRNYSYVIGFGENFPRRAHHRSSAGSAKLDGSSRFNDHLLIGALVGGLTKPQEHPHNDRRDDWVSNEVSIGYNATLTSASIQQYENYGGEALSDAQLERLISN